MGRFAGNKKKQRFQIQVLKAFLPAMVVVILVSGVFLYLLGTYQVKKNSEYLIANTTKQTANIIDDKLGLVLSRCNELNRSLAIWRLVTHPYEVGNKTQEYQDMINTHKNLQNLYNDSNGAIDSIAFQTVYGNRLNVYYDMVYDYSDLSLEGFYEVKNEGIFWMNAHEDQVFSTRIPREVLTLVIPYQNSKKENTATLVINFKAEYFKSLLKEAEISRHGYVFLLSQDGCMLPSGIENPYSISGKHLDRLRKLSGTGEDTIRGKGRGDSLAIHYTPLESNGWMAVSVTPHADLFGMLDSFKVLLLLIIIAAGLFSLAVSVYCSRLISRPVKELSDQVLEFDSNQNVVFNVKAGYEITTLAGGLNHLKMTVDRLLEQVREDQKQKSNLELMIMQAQIKPHFLYNTLGSIKSLAELGEDGKASGMCDALIQFYKISLSNGRSVINLGMEAELVSNYLKILEYRYEQKFEYIFELEGDVRNKAIPRMTLQPLVENAIYHGLKPKEGSGILVVSAELTDSLLVITVYDDGVGMAEEAVTRLRCDLCKEEITPGRQGGFALRNVYMRLKGFYGADVGMEIDSVRDVYTQVRLLIPLTAVEELTYV